MTAFFKPLKPISVYLFIFLISGIVAGNFSAQHKTAASFILVFFLISLLIFIFLGAIRIPKKRVVVIAATGLMFSIGYLAIQAKLYPDLPDNHISHFSGPGKYIVTGKIVSFARHDKRKTKYVLECHKIQTKTGEINVTGLINLSVYGRVDSMFQLNDEIRFKSKVKSIRNFSNPGGFNYRRFMQLQDIYGSAWVNSKKIQVVSSDLLSDPLFEDLAVKGIFSSIFIRLARKIETHRAGYYHFVSATTKYSDSGKVLVSLVAGKKEVLPNSVRDLFSKAGISHLLAISGLHLSIVCLLFFSFFYWVLSFFQQLLISGRSKKLAGILTIVPLVFYAVFTGFSPSTQRAIIMIMVVLISYASERQKDIISSLSIAGILILLFDAAALFSISFQLSFMAVAFIISGLALVKNLTFLTKKTVLSKAGMLIIVTFFAGLGTAPLTAYYFNMVSGIGIFSNVILIPLIGFVVLPLGLVSMLSFSMMPVLATKIVFFCCQLIEISITICEKMILIPFSWSRVVTPDLYLLVIIYLALFCLFLLFNKKVSFFLLTSICIAILAGFGLFEGTKNKSSDLLVTVLDVGQGNSALIQTRDLIQNSALTKNREKKNILVDGGGFSGFSSFDTGRFIVAPFLWKKQIRHLDYVILSHPEGDHLNGLLFILDNFKVDTLVKNSDQIKTANYFRLIELCKEKKIQIVEPLGKIDPMIIGDLQLLFFDTTVQNEFKDLNNNSLVFKLVYNKFSMLFAGDILQAREEKLRGLKNINFKSDVLLSPHHGSSTSSSKLFLDKVGPGSVIISCGWNNRYGFPHKKILNRYDKMGINIFRTDNDGAVIVSSDGSGHNIVTSKGGS